MPTAVPPANTPLFPSTRIPTHKPGLIPPRPKYPEYAGRAPTFVLLGARKTVSCTPGFSILPAKPVHPPDSGQLPAGARPAGHSARSPYPRNVPEQIFLHTGMNHPVLGSSKAAPSEPADEQPIPVPDPSEAMLFHWQYEPR